MYIEALLRVDLQAVLDELDDLLVITLPNRLAEIKIARRLIVGHFQRDAARDYQVEDYAKAPYIGLGRNLTLILFDLRCHIESFETAHFDLERQMLRHVNQLHHRNV